MTDPTGSVFISYRRSPARSSGNEEAALVCDALRRSGVPTWWDIDSLGYEPTEAALVATLSDPSLSGAILLISPEVAASSIVRCVEAVRIFRRHRARDGFWVLPVLIDLDYEDADSALGSPAGIQDLRRWNMYKVKGGTIRPSEARSIARCAVDARLKAIREKDVDGPLSVGVFSRCAPPTTFSLAHDFSAQFNGRKVEDGGYQAFENALLDGASRVLKVFRYPRLVGEGRASLPLGVLVGAVYSPKAGFEFGWSQLVEGRRRQLWSLSLWTDDMEMEMDTSVIRGDPASEDLVLAVGLSADIEHAVTESLSELDVTFRACLHCSPQAGSYKPGLVLEPNRGIRFVLSAIQTIHELRDDLTMKRANLHLFMACPLAMAVMLGQSLNTFAYCHLYEHDPGTTPSYTQVHTFQPSNLAYE